MALAERIIGFDTIAQGFSLCEDEDGLWFAREYSLYSTGGDGESAPAIVQVCAGAPICHRALRRLRLLLL